MKQQLVHIHGGDPHKSYEEYISFLKSYVIENLEYFKRRKWKETLQERLGDNFDVIAPKMPNDRNAKYLEWKIWFEKFLPFLHDNVILVGHSLGGIFLIKYLSENTFHKKIKAAFLISAPYDNDASDYSLADFVLPKSLEQFKKQTGKIFLYHSKDDQVVPFLDLKKYQKELPTAKIFVFNNRGHFNQEEFPELIKDVLSVDY